MPVSSRSEYSRVSTSWFLGHRTSPGPNFRCRIGHATSQSKGDPSTTHCREANRSSSPVYWLTGCSRRSNRRAVVPDSALATAVTVFWSARIEDFFIDGSFCTEKPDPGDVDGYTGSNLTMLYMIESILIGFSNGSRSTCSEKEVADVGRSWRGVLHPAHNAGRSGHQVPGSSSGKIATVVIQVVRSNSS